MTDIKLYTILFSTLAIITIIFELIVNGYLDYIMTIGEIGVLVIMGFKFSIWILDVLMSFINVKEEK